MLKLVLKGFILIAIIHSLNLILFHILVNTSIFSIESEIKLKESEIIKTVPEVLIIGSSRTITAINPKKLTGGIFQNKDKIYNFGITSLFFPNTYYLVNSVEKKLKFKPKFILIELGFREDFNTSFPNQLLSSDLFYFFKELNFIDFTKYLNLQIVNSFKWTKTISYKKSYQYSKGYISTLGMSKTNDNDYLQHLLFLKNGKDTLPFLNPNSPVKIKDKSFETKLMHVYINRLVENYSNKSIKIYFYVPNRLGEKELAIIKPLYDSLPDSIKFNPNKSPQFQQLMRPEYSWDAGHLTEDGADIYTKIFAEEFKKQIIDKGYLKN